MSVSTTKRRFSNRGTARVAAAAPLKHIVKDEQKLQIYFKDAQVNMIEQEETETLNEE